MTKALKRAMMKRTELANKYHKHRRPEDFARFRKHRNYVDRLYKRERREYFNRLKKNDIEDIKCFWKTVKPLLSEKGNVKNEIKIVKDNVIIDDNQAVAEEFNSKFTNVVQELNIDFNWNTDENIESIKDPIQKAIERYKSHPSIIVIREKLPNPNIIDFVDIKENELEKMMANFNTKKGTSFGSVPGKILKDNRKNNKRKTNRDSQYR